MNKRSFSTIIGYIILIILLIIISIILFFSEYRIYALVPLVISLISIILFIRYMINTRSEETLYISKLNNILKTYYSILVEIDELPDIGKKDVVKVEQFNDLMNAQNEIEKPIFYKIGESSAIFILLDDTLACIHTLRKNKDTDNEFEEYINSNKKAEVKTRENSNDDKRKLNVKFLEELDKTMTIKLKNKKVVKISPVKTKENEKDPDVPKLKKAEE